MTEPRGDRDGHLHHRQRQRPGRLQPGPATGACRWAASTDVRVDPRGGAAIEIDFEVFLDRLHHDWARTSKRIRQSPTSAAFPQTSGAGGGEPGDRRGLPAARLAARTRRRRSRSAFTPDRPYVAVDAVAAGDGAGSPAGGAGTRAKRHCRRSGRSSRRIPDSLDRSDRFFTNIERIIRESDLPALSADSRKFFSDDEHADRRRSPPISTAWSAPRDARDARRTRRATAMHDADLPAATQSAREALRAAPASPPTTCGGRCRPSAIRSSSCASSRGSSRSSRSRWSMAPVPRSGSPNDPYSRASASSSCSWVRP